jgi:hypothetical protein
MAVVDNLLAYVYRLIIDFEGTLDHFNGPFDPCTKAPRFGQDYSV